MLLKLQPYNYELVYWLGMEVVIIDIWSQPNLMMQQDAITDMEVIIDNMHTVSLQPEQLKEQATDGDKDLQSLKKQHPELADTH